MLPFGKKGKAAPGADPAATPADPDEEPGEVDETGEAPGEDEATSNDATVPDDDHTWLVTASRDLSTAFLDFTPDPEVETPEARKVLDAAIALGVPATVLFSEEKLERAIVNTRNSGIPLKRYPISEDCDASFEISVSEDKLTATLTIEKGRGRGKALDLKELGAAIRSSGLKGMDLPTIKEDLLAFYRGDQLRLDSYRLAAGTPPERGKPRELTWEVTFLDEEKIAKHKQQHREAKPEWNESLETLAEAPVESVPEMALVLAESVVVSLTPVDPGKPGVDVYGTMIPAPEPPAPPLEIHEHLRLGPDSVIAERDGMFDRWEATEGVWSIRVRPFRDCRVQVNVSEDAMLASVKLTEGVGSGLHLTSEYVRQSLIDAGVIKGIDLDAVAEAIRRAVEEGDASEIVVARGKPPVEPGASRITFAVNLASGKGVTIRDDGSADFKNQDRITTVDEGRLIAKIVSDEMKKEDGWDVRSKVLKAKDSPRLQIEIGEGIRQETNDDGMIALFAAKAGELVYDGKGLSIGEIHTIQGNVGPTSGNVKFGGSVNISGSVTTGYFVMSKGTVKIVEGVEASLVSADESIYVQQGVKGAGKAVLRARQEIHAGFIEQATVMGVGNIVVQNTCLHCTIKSNGALTLATEKGRLVGGTILVRRGLSAMHIGSAKGVQTHISFGQDYLIGDKIELEEKEIEKVQQELVRLEGKIHAAERERAIADVKKGRARKVQLLKLIEKRTERLFWLRERFEQHFPSQVEVRGTIYPGVVLESHGRTLEIVSEKKQVVFTFDPESGHINESALKKS